MRKQVKEMARLSLTAKEYKGRREDRVYEDQVWSYAMNTGKSPWKNGVQPQGESDFHA